MQRLQFTTTMRQVVVSCIGLLFCYPLLGTHKRQLFYNYMYHTIQIDWWKFNTTLKIVRILYTASQTFMEAAKILEAWLEKGSVTSRNSSRFYTMLNSVNSYIRRLTGLLTLLTYICTISLYACYWLYCCRLHHCAWPKCFYGLHESFVPIDQNETIPN